MRLLNAIYALLSLPFILPTLCCVISFEINIKNYDCSHPLILESNC